MNSYKDIPNCPDQMHQQLDIYSQPKEGKPCDTEVQQYNLNKAFQDREPLLIYYSFSVLQKAISANKFDQESIASFISEIALVHPVPPDFLSEVHVLISKEIEIVTNSPPIDFTENFSLNMPESIYRIFYNGKFKYHFNKVPDEILTLKNNFTFWMDLTNNEFLCKGKTVPKEHWLAPKHHALLMYFCLNSRTRKKVTIQEIFRSVWPNKATTTPKNIRNSINVAINAINSYADTNFISKSEDAYVEKIYGTDEYIIKPKCTEQLCLINCTCQQ
jgi:hypothetical protein